MDHLMTPRSSTTIDRSSMQDGPQNGSRSRRRGGPSPVESRRLSLCESAIKPASTPQYLSRPLTVGWRPLRQRKRPFEGTEATATATRSTTTTNINKFPQPSKTNNSMLLMSLLLAILVVVVHISGPARAADPTNSATSQASSTADQSPTGSEPPSGVSSLAAAAVSAGEALLSSSNEVEKSPKSIVASLSSAVATAAAAAAVAAARESLASQDARSLLSSAATAKQQAALRQQVVRLAADSIPEVPYNILHNMKKIDHAAPFYNLPSKVAAGATKESGGGVAAATTSSLEQFSLLLRSPIWKRLADGYGDFASEFRTLFKAPVTPLKGGASSTAGKLLREISVPALLMLVASALPSEWRPTRTRRKSVAPLAPESLLSAPSEQNEQLDSTLAHFRRHQQPNELNLLPGDHFPADWLLHQQQHQQQYRQHQQQQQEQQQHHHKRQTANPDNLHLIQSQGNQLFKRAGDLSRIENTVSMVDGGGASNPKPVKTGEDNLDGEPNLIPAPATLLAGQHLLPSARPQNGLSSLLSSLTFSPSSPSSSSSSSSSSSPSSTGLTSGAPAAAPGSATGRAAALIMSKLMREVGHLTWPTFQQASSDQLDDKHSYSLIGLEDDNYNNNNLQVGPLAFGGQLNRWPQSGLIGKPSTRRQTSADSEQRDLSQLLPNNWREAVKRTVNTVQQQASSQWRSIEGQVTNWIQDKLKPAPATNQSSLNQPFSNVLASVGSTAFNMLGLAPNKLTPAATNSDHQTTVSGHHQTTNDSQTTTTTTNNNAQQRIKAEPTAKPIKGPLAGITEILVSSLAAKLQPAAQVQTSVAANQQPDTMPANEINKPQQASTIAI